MRIPAGLFRFGGHLPATVRMYKTKTEKPVKVLPPCPPSYDDLPEPIGDWETHYNANQMKYNIQLGASLLFLIGTIVTAKVGGFFHLNYDPPDKPGVRQC